MTEKPLSIYIKSPPPQDPDSHFSYLEDQLQRIETTAKHHTVRIQQNNENAKALYEQEVTARVEADSAEVTAREALASRVTTTEGGISSLTGRVTTAEAAITTEATTRADAISAEATARQALASRVTTTEGGISSLTGRVTTAEASITTESTTRASADSALSSRIDNIVAVAGDGATAAIDAEATARIAADEALATQITTVSSKASAQRVFTQSSAPSSTGRITGDLWFDSSNGNKQYYWNGTSWADNSDGRFSSLASSITSEATARTNADSALATQITNVSAQATAQRVFNQTSAPSSTGRIIGDIWYDTDDGNKPYYWNGTAWTENSDNRFSVIAASVTTESNARATADTALSNQITALSSTVAGNTAAITNEATTRANADSAISSQITKLSASSNKKIWRQASEPTWNDIFPVGTNGLSTSNFDRVYWDSSDAQNWGIRTFALSSVVNSVSLSYMSSGSLLKDDIVLKASVGNEAWLSYTISGVDKRFVVFQFGGPVTPPSSVPVYCKYSIVPGQTYEFSAYLGSVNCRSYLAIEIYDSSGTSLGTVTQGTATTITPLFNDSVNNNTLAGGASLENFKKASIGFTAPANAAYIGLLIAADNRITATGLSSPILYIARPYFGKLPYGQLSPSEWKPFDPPAWYDSDDNNNLYLWSGINGYAWIQSADSRIAANTASITNEATTRANADSALSASITNLTSTVGNNYNTLNASITSEATTRANADSALSTSVSNLSSTVTNNYNTLNASITSEATTRANADTALTNSVNTLSSTVSGHTSSISTLSSTTADITGALSAQWAVQGTIDGTTGGLRLTGLKKADGTGATYNLIIDANTTINGSLVVNGSIATGKIADNAISNNWYQQGTSGATSTTLSIPTTAGNRYIIFAVYAGGQPSSVAGSANLQVSYSYGTKTSITSMPVLFAGTGLVLNVSFGYSNYTGSFVNGLGGTLNYNLPSATLVTSWTAPSTATASIIAEIGGYTQPINLYVVELKK